MNSAGSRFKRFASTTFNKEKKRQVRRTKSLFKRRLRNNSKILSRHVVFVFGVSIFPLEFWTVPIVCFLFCFVFYFNNKVQDSKRKNIKRDTNNIITQERRSRGQGGTSIDPSVKWRCLRVQKTLPKWNILTFRDLLYGIKPHIIEQLNDISPTWTFSQLLQRIVNIKQYGCNMRLDWIIHYNI